MSNFTWSYISIKHMPQSHSKIGTLQLTDDSEAVIDSWTHAHKCTHNQCTHVVCRHRHTVHNSCISSGQNEWKDKCYISEKNRWSKKFDKRPHHGGGQTPKNCLSSRGSGPHLIHGPWAHHSPHTNQRLNWFGCFSTAYGYVQQTNTQTTKHR